MAPRISDKIRIAADKIRGPKKPELRLLPLDFVDTEAPTKVESLAPPSLPARVGKHAADGWKATPRPVQIIGSITALVAALTALAQVLAPLFK